MPSKTIEFAQNTAQEALIAPWDNPEQSSYHDLLLKPEFACRKYKFPSGATWFRIVPPLRESKRGWMLGLHVLNYAGGRHVHPRSLHAGGKSVFDLAYAWAKENRPEVLFNKSNKNGFRLLPDPVCAFWILVEEAGKTVARIVCASGYDGSRGGTPGLGHQLWRATQELDEHGRLVAKPAHPTDGVQICIEKSQAPGSKYPSYALRVGRTPAPMAQFIERMDQEEIAALVPLESVIHVPAAEQEWTLLEKVIDPATVAEIREAQG
jgi:hypothetical protein